MIVEQFKRLGRAQQENHITNYGEFLSVHTIQNEKFGLYDIDNFFVEIRCENDSLRVLEISMFVTGLL
ncbi:MAG: hypothetical protein ACJA2M_002792, partial [Polaribacter sp.]